MAAMAFHVRLATGFLGLRNKELLNLDREELEQILMAWRSGEPLLIDGRRWLPDATRLTVYEGPALTSNQRSMGQGWSNAIQFGENITRDAIGGRLPGPPLPPTTAAEQGVGDGAPHGCDQRAASHRRRLADSFSRYASVIGGLLAVLGGVIAALVGVSSIPALLTVVVVLAASVFGAAFIRDRNDHSHMVAFLALVTGCFVWLAVWAARKDTSSVAHTQTVVLPGALRRVRVSMRVTIKQPRGRSIRPGVKLTVSGSSSPLPAGGVLWLIANENNYYNALGTLNVSGSGEWSSNQTLGTTADKPGMRYELLVVLVLDAEQDARFQAAANIFNEGSEELTSAEILPDVLARRSFTGN
jgi:hypothetical protein